MFKVTLVVLLLESLVATAHGADQCNCTDIQKSLNDLKTVVDYLRENLQQQFSWPIDTNVTCPPGFTYLPSAAKCYQVVYEGHDWYSAGRRCEGLRSGSDLAAITSATENDALKTFLESELARNAGNNVCDLPGYGKLFWTSGQQKIKRNCRSPFVWRTQGGNEVPFGFSIWAAGEPNCGSAEMCMHIWVARNFDWKDGSCTDKICPLCEYKP